MNILLYGNERYLLNQKLTSILERELGSMDLMNLAYYDALVQPFSMHTILEDADTLPFFAEKKVIVIKNAIFLTKGHSLDKHELSELMNYLAQDNQSSVLIFMHDNDNLDTTKPLVKALMNHAEIIRVKKLEPYEFRKVLSDLLKTRNIQLDTQAFEILLLRLDDNLSNAHQELEKLQLYHQKLTVEDIEALVSRPLDNEVFHLVNAILDHDMKKAFSIWNDMMVLNMEPLSFVGLIASQLRLMYQVSSLQSEGYHREDMINLLSVSNPTINVSRVNRVLQLAKNTSPKRLLEILNHLALLDQKSKMGLVDKKFGFELFLIEAMI
jgi:DNA polymerase III subunit delta